MGVKNRDAETKVETRQQVCLLYFFRGSDFARFFYKKI